MKNALRTGIVGLFLLLSTGLLMAKGADEPSVGSPGGLEPVELTWYMSGVPNSGEQEVYAAVNEYLKKKINTTVNFKVFAPSEYNDRMSVKIAAGEEFDLMFTADWINNFYQNISKGAFTDVSKLLPEYAPKRYAAVPQWVWDGMSVDGHLYGMVNGFIAWQDAVYVRDDLAAKYKLEKNIRELADFEPFFLRVLEGEGYAPFPLAGGNRNGQFINILSVGSGLEFVAGLGLPAGFFIDDKSVTVINPYATEEMKKHYELLNKWYELGIINSDAPVLQNTDALRQSGRFAAGTTGAFYKGVDEEQINNRGGFKTTSYITSDPYVPFDAITKTITAVSATSKNPERAVMVYELANTDREFFRLLAAGIEGKHYIDKGNNFIEPIADSGYPGGWSWAWADLDRNGFLIAGTPEGVAEGKINGVLTADPSPILGFSLDTSPIKTELAQITSVIDESLPVLSVGAVDPTAELAKLNERLKSAGLDRFISEIQKQIDAYLADK
jgi:putative aldouronate transport system substrate-binding protein